MDLRAYQSDLIDKITTAAAEGKKRILVQSPVGSGKTCIFSEIIRHAISNGKRALVIVHTRELLQQAKDKLYALGIECGIILADEPHDPTLACQVGSIQSLHAKCVRRSRIALPPADIIIGDENHRAMARTWQEVFIKYPDAFIVGWTATPIRKDGKGLGNFFDTLILGPSIKELIEQKYLVDIKTYAPSIPDLKGVKISCGDYVEKDLERKMDQPQIIGDIIKNWTAIANGKKTLVFASGVKHSIHITQSFDAIGIKAAHIDGSTPKPDRDKIVQEFRDGKIMVMSSVDVFTEGFDVPNAEVLVFARPTRSLRIFLQAVGRIMRPAPGKEFAILLDHSASIYEFGLPTEEWDWQLDYGTAKTIKEKMLPIWKDRKKKNITCKQCTFVYTGRIDCPMCHWRPRMQGKDIPTFEAYLQEITTGEFLSNKTIDRKAWYFGIRAYADGRNFKNRKGWAAHTYRDKFGVWPAGQYVHEADSMTSFPEIPIDVQAWLGARYNAWKAKQDQAWQWKAKEKVDQVVSAHGLSRKDVLAGDAYIQGND